MKNIIFFALAILLITSACTTNVTKDNVKMHFGDLPDNPFETNKKR